MKGLLEEQLPHHNSNNASTCDQSKDDQEMGSSAMSKSGNVFSNSGFSCFPRGMDLNLGRVVREIRPFSQFNGLRIIGLPLNFPK